MYINNTFNIQMCSCEYIVCNFRKLSVPISIHGQLTIDMPCHVKMVCMLCLFGRDTHVFNCYSANILCVTQSKSAMRFSMGVG